jgi:tetratricopeptide (TPR) repeat protein
MRYDDYEDDEDFVQQRRPSGVSAGWRVAALIAFVLLGLALLVLIGVAIDNATSSPEPPFNAPPVGMPFAPPMAPAQPPVQAADDEDDNGDPRLLPYPLTQDLRPPGEVLAVVGEAPAKREPEPREQLLRAGEILWTSDEPSGPDLVLVSPDGQTIAYAGSRGVMVGPPRAVELVPGTEPTDVPPHQQGAEGLPTISAWSADGNFLYWAAADGRLRQVKCLPGFRGAIDFLNPPLRGRCAVPLPDQRLVLVRHRARPKVEGPNRQSAADPSEVVVFDIAQRATRILIPASTAVWRSPAVSPDGRRLALISDSGHETELPRLWRVFVIDVAGGEPKALTPAAARAGSVCWGLDGKTLIYDRSAAVNSDDAVAGDGYRTNLFEVDPTMGRETPLTVGGGFSSPSISRGGDLYGLSQHRDGNNAKVELFRLPLARAREFTAGQLARRRSAKVWTNLAADVLAEAGLPADTRPPALDEEKVKKLATAFAKLYRERLRSERPDTAAELDALRAEARGLTLPAAERSRIALVLGAVEGEYLCRKHGARWVLTKPNGPPLADPKPDELFRHIINPFRDFMTEDFDEDDEPGFGTLTATLNLAEGRTLVLAHDTAVRLHVPAADPDLARGIGLLKDGRGDEADRVLLEMTKRHAGNIHLTLHVGALLCEHGRKEALRTLTQGLNADALKDARVYNLMGLARLDNDPQRAITDFRNALRCNLYHGPAYFNLAQAYEKTNDVVSARRCLRRYLKLMPYAPQAEDARRRLAELPPDAGRGW